MNLSLSTFALLSVLSLFSLAAAASTNGESSQHKRLSISDLLTPSSPPSLKRSRTSPASQRSSQVGSTPPNERSTVDYVQSHTPLVHHRRSHTSPVHQRSPQEESSRPDSPAPATSHSQIHTPTANQVISWKPINVHGNVAFPNTQRRRQSASYDRVVFVDPENDKQIIPTAKSFPYVDPESISSENKEKLTNPMTWKKTFEWNCLKVEHAFLTLISKHPKNAPPYNEIEESLRVLLFKSETIDALVGEQWPKIMKRSSDRYQRVYAYYHKAEPVKIREDDIRKLDSAAGNIENILKKIESVVT
ncbi:hypothetical protein BJ684DRAFT_15485 [Piptocephalis cylindrospora]|uniref:Uncharacterized protein n=1 Tax=Piptocephalis cylindrospora TaxID=1907219 RepID=A0A4P9Y588_9FUNG|nr:hypothetical protein BJ684DRAFT_15485 [Piptocephalis cylindrospora]|eukprot:RKP14178.1 hypothetical protein BJ684DRAFT_15485 [Piptocephalis cylindrospora]